MEDLERQNLDAALYKERSLLRVPCMRGSLYIVPATDYVAYYQATKPFFQRGLQDLNSFLAQTGRECDGKKALCDKELIQRVLEVTSSLGPHTIAELSNLLPALNSHIYYDPEYPDLGYNALGTQLIPALCAQGLLVRAQARGGWRSQLYTYTTLSSWLPQIDLESLSGKEGLRRVVEVYVAAFGPVTVGDISLWLGGYARRQVVATLMSLRGRLARIQILDSPGDYFMLKEQIDELRACSYSQPSVSLQVPPN